MPSLSRECGANSKTFTVLIALKMPSAISILCSQDMHSMILKNSSLSLLMDFIKTWTEFKSSHTSLQLKNITKQNWNLRVKAGWLILREINPSLLILWQVSTDRLSLALIANINQQLSIHSQLSVSPFLKPQKQWLTFSSFMETWKRKLKDHGLSTHQTMQPIGIKKLAKPWELIFPDAACTQFLQNKIFTKLADNQWLKSLIKSKMKEKIFSWLSIPNKNWRFQNKTQCNSHTDAQKQLTTALKIYSLSYQ